MRMPTLPLRGQRIGMISTPRLVRRAFETDLMRSAVGKSGQQPLPRIGKYRQVKPPRCANLSDRPCHRLRREVATVCRRAEMPASCSSHLEMPGADTTRGEKGSADFAAKGGMTLRGLLRRTTIGRITTSRTRCVSAARAHRTYILTRLSALSYNSPARCLICPDACRPAGPPSPLPLCSARTAPSSTPRPDARRCLCRAWACACTSTGPSSPASAGAR